MFILNNSIFVYLCMYKIYYVLSFHILDVCVALKNIHVIICIFIYVYMLIVYVLVYVFIYDAIYIYIGLFMYRCMCAFI